LRKWIVCVARRLGKIATGLARLLPPSYTKSSPTSAGVLYTPALFGPYSLASFHEDTKSAARFPRITSTESVRKVRAGLKLRLCESENGAKTLSPGRSRPTNLPLILRSNYFSDGFRKGSSRNTRISCPRRYTDCGRCGSVPEYYA
jgi:hypothetical protein